jgi:hypothetical protein
MAKILRSTLEQGNSGDDFRAELLSVHAPPEEFMPKAKRESLASHYPISEAVG